MTNSRNKLGRELEPGDQIFYEGMICTVDRRGDYMYAIHKSASVPDFSDWILPDKTYVFVRARQKKTRRAIYKLSL